LDTRGVTPAMRSRLLVDIGEARSAAGDLSGARAVLGQALAIDRGLGTEGQADVARDLEALGAVAFYGDKFSEARQLINSALRLRTAIEGENSPSVTDNRNLLAHIAYTEGDIAGAEALYRGNLARDQRVLGLKHPDTGVTMNNIARMLVDQRRFAEAAPLLERAIAVVEGQRGPKATDLVFMRWNLGLVRRYTGHATQADALFGQAVDLAREAGHPMLGPVLVDRADLACQTGHARQGMMMADEAVRIVAADYPDVPWRIAWAQTVRGTCLIRNARMAEGRATIVAAQPVLVRRWPAGTLLGQAARTALAEAQNH